MRVQDVNALSAWREKCRELILREKIMIYRLNEQEKSANKSLSIYKARMASQEAEMEECKKKASRAEDELERTKIICEETLRNETALICREFEEQMGRLQRLFDT